jgi:PAS domain S-box-containing protein
MNNLLTNWREGATGRARPRWAMPRFVIECLLFAAAYGAAARIGLAYSSLAPNVTLIWAPTGISLFVILRFGPRLWPGIVIGDLIANAGTGVPLWAIGGIALGNIAQTLLCCAALHRVGFHDGLQRVRDVVALLSFGSAGAALSATIGPGVLVLAGNIETSAYGSVWLQWLMGDATGVVVFAPLLLAWWRGSGLHATPSRRFEAAALLLLLLVLCLAIFSPLLDSALPVAPGYYPAALALFPLAVWAALRFGLRGATLLTLLVSVAAVWGTVHGLGPFVDGTQTSSLLRWWVFANVITVTSLLLAASQIERDHARIEAIRDRDFSRAVLDAEGALLVVLDADWRIRRVNRSFEALTGFTQGELAGQAFEAGLIPEEQHGKFTGHAELLRLNLSESARLDSLLRRRRGPPITVSWTTSVLRDGAGRIAHVIVSGIDVSARVDAAEALRHARRQLEARVAERTRDLAEANAGLQVQMAERQRLEGEIIQVSEREQQRFGQELHDGLGQHLTATAIQAELLARDLDGLPDAQRSARQIEAMVSDAVAQTRLLARGLFPVEIEDNGLMAALQQLAETTQRALRRPCVLDCPRPVELRDHTVAIHLYRIAQEAVNNALKHAPGAPIALSLQHLEGVGLRLSVLNPADTPSPAGRRGMGLRIMRHRAQLIGASLQAGLVDGQWQVTLVLPES